MNKRRLLKLADLLEADAKNKEGIKFSLHGWGMSDDFDRPVTHSCGTTACALGLAVISGAFARAGLRNASKDKTSVMPAIGRSRGFYAAARLFDITQRHAHYLFSAMAYPYERTTKAVGERYVARRIREFVAGKVLPS